MGVTRTGTKSMIDSSMSFHLSWDWGFDEIETRVDRRVRVEETDEVFRSTECKIMVILSSPQTRSPSSR